MNASHPVALMTTASLDLETRNFLADVARLKNAERPTAVAWFRTSDREALTTYCARDLEITSNSNEIGCENASVLYTSRLGTKMQVALPG